MPMHPEHFTHPSQAKTSASTTTQPPWNPIKELSPAHIEIIKQSVHGLAPTRIRYHMQRLGEKYSKTHIIRVLQSEKGRQYASLYSALHFGGMQKLVEVGSEYAPEAISHVLDIMRNPVTGERHRLAAADSIMDRVGPPKISRQENENRQPTMVVINLLPSQLSQFAMPQPTIEAEVVQLLDNPSSNDD